ncbi:MAG: glycerol-3-phosphate acyltransferase, partial [Anaerolineaceae bacterium]|nr:glycerol-3-phosphate acyltransferase [Anaerolineaceae bacterium]
MNFMVVLYALGFALLGYLSGSFPFAVWITRLVKGVDVRDNGSGHATTTNTIRQAGFLPGAAVFILDVSKGFLPTWLAIHYAPATWIIALTASTAVIGHCWPIFAGFRGGMGLATANGGLMAFAPVAILITYALLIALTLIIRQSARASVVAGLLFAPVLWVAGLRGPVIWTAIVVGIIIALRFTIDWNREYKELWLDRDKE